LLLWGSRKNLMCFPFFFVGVIGKTEERGGVCALITLQKMK